MKQHEAVIEAMIQTGGYATLGQLYQTVLKIPGCSWGTKTPFASIRRIVQTHSEFFKIKPGLWGLTAQREHVLKSLGISPASRPTKVQEFDHSYYQGLIIEIGNFRGYQTFVPAQDKNKAFLHRSLTDIASLKAYHEFTFENLLRRARTVDVTWFNERKMPRAFFEVEHSTDIQNSMLKFLEFQDFRIDFFIVADPLRRREFNDKLGYTAFSPVRSLIKFLDYETISDWHTKIAASVVARELM
jgi:hypothetical protein